MESHSYTVTLNYYTEEDVFCMEKVIFKSSVDYYIFGFEGDCCDTYHSHIHLAIHFKSSVKFDTFKRYWNKNHHIEVIKDWSKMVMYCKGYDWFHTEYRLKCCRENVWFDEGNVPLNGVKKNEESKKVMDEVLKGTSIDDLRKLFPRFMLYHQDKVRKWYEYEKKDVKRDRKLIVINKEARFKHASEHLSVTFDESLDTYMGEKVLFITFSHDFKIIDWMHGFPQKLRRGFEIIKVDPDIVYYMAYDTRDYNRFIGMYVNYLTENYYLTDI